VTPQAEIEIARLDKQLAGTTLGHAERTLWRLQRVEAAAPEPGSEQKLDDAAIKVAVARRDFEVTKIKHEQLIAAYPQEAKE
jgi:hypothetical protein